MKERLLSGQFNVALLVQFAKESGDKMGTPETGGSKNGRQSRQGSVMSEMQFTQALIIILLVALFGLICWLAILLHELTRTVRAAATMMQDRLTANYDVVQKLVTELQDVRAAVTAQPDTKRD
jgi:hypothetical protein